MRRHARVHGHPVTQASEDVEFSPPERGNSRMTSNLGRQDSWSSAAGAHSGEIDELQDDDIEMDTSGNGSSGEEEVARLRKTSRKYVISFINLFWRAHLRRSRFHKA